MNKGPTAQPPAAVELPDEIVAAIKVPTASKTAEGVCSKRTASDWKRDGPGEMFVGEVVKTPHHVRVIAVHIKIRYREQVIRELEALDLGEPRDRQMRKVFNF